MDTIPKKVMNHEPLSPINLREMFEKNDDDDYSSIIVVVVD